MVSAAHKGSKDSLSLEQFHDSRRYLERKTPSRGLVDGKKSMTIRVTSTENRSVRIRVKLDGETVLVWQGLKTDLTTKTRFAMPTESIGLTNWWSTVLFHRIQLRLLRPGYGAPRSF